MTDELFIEREKLGELVKLGDGGQGVVYRAPRVTIPYVGSAVYKEYLPDVASMLTPAGLVKAVELFTCLARPEIEALLSLAAWPVGLVRTKGMIAGFLMPEVPQRFYTEVTLPSGAKPTRLAKIAFLLNSERYLVRSGLQTSREKLYGLLREIAAGLTFLHKYGITIGDLSARNVLFSIDDPPACHFIDCDSMSINGERALPDVESPGWEIRAVSREPTSTAASDCYKFGLLTLRILAGNQYTRNPADLDTSVSERVRRLIEQTLNVDPSKRPTLDRWRALLSEAAGSEPRFVLGHYSGPVTGYTHSRLKGPYRPKIPFAFLGGTYASSHELAEYLTSQWDQGAQLAAGLAFEELVVWLNRSQPPSPGLQTVIDACRNKRFSPDRLVAMLLNELAPDLPPRFVGYAVDPASLAELARLARSGDGKRQEITHRLLTSHALISYAGLPTCDSYALLDDTWQRNVTAVLAWAKSSPQLKKQLEQSGESSMEANILLALMDDSDRDALAMARERADSPEARTQAWFRKFRNTKLAQPDLQPAYDWAIAAVAPLAEAQHAKEIERQRLAEEARLKAEKVAAEAEAAAAAAARARQEEAARQALVEWQRGTEGWAKSLLNRKGLAVRYEIAVEVEGIAVASAAEIEAAFPLLLAPMPHVEPLSERVVKLAPLLPVAAARLDGIAQLATALSSELRRRAKKSVLDQEAAQPGPEPEAPVQPAAPIPHRTRYLLALLALTLLTAAMALGVLRHSSFHMSLRAILIKLMTWLFCSTCLLAGWLGFAGSWKDRRAVHRAYAVQKRDFTEALSAFRRLDAEYRRDVEVWAEASAAVTATAAEDHRRADVLDRVARQCRKAADDLRDDTLNLDLQALVERIQSPAPTAQG